MTVLTDLLKPAMKAFELNGNSNNLLNSSVLSILAYIKQEKQRMLIDHLVSNYRPQLEAIDYAAIGQDLVLKYVLYLQLVFELTMCQI